MPRRPAKFLRPLLALVAALALAATVAAQEVQHPLVDCHIDAHSCGDLLALLGARGVIDTGLAWRARAVAAAEVAA